VSAEKVQDLLRTETSGEEQRVLKIKGVVKRNQVAERP
jgi:hypothetical protein